MSSFWAAHISKLPSAGQYTIHYDGWGNEWDETVGPTRIRRLSPPEN